MERKGDFEVDPETQDRELKEEHEGNRESGEGVAKAEEEAITFDDGTEAAREVRSEGVPNSLVSSMSPSAGISGASANGTTFPSSSSLSSLSSSFFVMTA